MSIKFPARRLVSQEDSALVQRPDVPRSKFTGSWTRKTTFNAGQLVPFMCEEVLPGDMLKYDVTAYVRMSTPLFPIMDNQRIDTFFFFVPNRLVWDNWVKFMGEQVDPDSSINYTVPVVTTPLGGFAPNSVFDHFGLPTTGQLDPAGALFVNVMPLRAYNLIYNQWFRDENLQNSAYFTKADTDIGAPATNYVLRYRAKSADYFTSCLPWPQKFTAPSVPLGGNAPVLGIGIDAAWASVNNNNTFRQSDGSNEVWNPWSDTIDADNVPFAIKTAAIGGGSYRPDVFADLSQASGVAINTLRQAFLTQQLLERDARGGTRYTEIVKSHFGVTSPDMRLQRPEYCGGGSSPFNITPVAQTVPFVAGEDSSPLGNLGGAGTSVGQHRASYAATEHGYIIGLINVKSELSYQQGIHKMWTRQTRYDFYWPSLAGLGEQAVLRKEIYVRGVPAEDDTVFGYQERWHEYRTHVSEVTGMFKSTTAGNIDEWHLAQQFNPAPTLSGSFIVDDPPMDRVLAGQLVPNNYLSYLADILIRREAVRPLPVYGTPVTLGRF